MEVTEDGAQSGVMPLHLCCLTRPSKRQRPAMWTRSMLCLKHYERYIAALATRTLYDENGVPHLCLDEEKVCRMRTKLITKILDFKVNKTA
ncbi:MAG: helix-turn-helix domain-containing protein [Oscillibacter sp.]